MTSSCFHDSHPSSLSLTFHLCDFIFFLLFYTQLLLYQAHPPECQGSATFPKPLPPTCVVPSTFRSTKKIFLKFYCGPCALRAQLQQLAKFPPSSPQFQPHLAAFLFPLHCVLFFHTILFLCSFSFYCQVRFSLFASLASSTPSPSSHFP